MRIHPAAAAAAADKGGKPPSSRNRESAFLVVLTKDAAYIVVSSSYFVGENVCVACVFSLLSSIPSSSSIDVLDSSACSKYCSALLKKKDRRSRRRDAMLCDGSDFAPTMTSLVED